MSIWTYWPWRIHCAAVVCWLLVLIDFGAASVFFLAGLICLALFLELVALAWACFAPEKRQ
jgi:hypothetical protein